MHVSPRARLAAVVGVFLTEAYRRSAACSAQCPRDPVEKVDGKPGLRRQKRYQWPKWRKFCARCARATIRSGDVGACRPERRKWDYKAAFRLAQDYEGPHALELRELLLQLAQGLFVLADGARHDVSRPHQPRRSRSRR